MAPLSREPSLRGMRRWLVAAAAALLVGGGVRAQPQPQPSYAPVAAGVPVQGTVARGAYAFYQLVVPIPLPRIAIVLTPLLGQASLFVTMGPFWTPERGNCEWQSTSTYGDSAVFLAANASFTALGYACRVAAGDTNCTLNVGVLGVKSASYSLVVATGGTAGSASDGSQLLLPGVPSGGLLPPGASDVYNLSAPAPVTFRVTPLSGGGGGGGGSGGGGLGAYVASSSAGQSVPDPSDPASYCASATAPAAPGPTGALVLTVAPGAACGCAAAPANCTLFVTVAFAAGGGAALRYTIAATTGAARAVDLLDGAPQDGGDLEGGTSLFLFQAQLDPPGGGGGGSSSSSVEVVLTPTRGSARLYVLAGSAATAPGALPGPGSFSYASSGGSGSQVVTVSAADAAFTAACPSYATAPCPLLMGVLTTSASSAWAIVAASAAYVTLVPGVPTEGVAPLGAVAYYRLPVAQPGQAVVITTAAVAGDPALFVGCDRDNSTTRPVPSDPSSYTWAAQGSGDQLLVIDPSSDARACASAPCSYYIGVTSADFNSSAAFFLLGRSNASGAAATPLVVGDALQDYVPGGSCNAYATPLDLSIPSLTVSVYTASGAVVAFARLDNATLSPASYQYAALPVGGDDGSAGWQVLVVADTDAAFNASCRRGWPCALALLVCDNTTGPVAAPSSASSYTLTAAADETRLVDALPVTGTVQAAPAMALYRFTLPARAPFVVRLTPLSGDPDLLMSAGLVPPNATSAQWASASPDGDFFSVTFTEPWLDPARNPQLTWPLDFWIGVSGYDGAAEFSLVATSSPYVTLENGLPQAVQASPGVLSYFLLTLPQADARGAEVGFSLALTPISGDPQPLVFVNTVNHTRAACAHCGFPSCRDTPCTPGQVTQYNRHWSSGEQGPLTFTVDASDPNYETESAFVVAVLAQGAAPSTFSVTATFSDSLARLQNQIPTPGTVRAGEYVWFFIDMVIQRVQLTVSLTVVGGAPDLFVSVNSSVRRPNATAFSKAATWPGEQVLVFTWAELPECPDSSVDHTVFCHAYIGVRGGGGLNASFSLLADAVNPNATDILLQDGQPVAGILAQAEYAYYRAIVDVAPTTTYSVTLNPYGTAKLDLYATTDGSRPSETNFQFGSWLANGPEQLTIAPGAPGYNNSCVLRVAVLHPFVALASYDVTFESRGLTTLSPGQPSWGNVQVVPPPPAVQFARYYAISAGSPAAPGQDEVAVAATFASGLQPQLWVGATAPGNASGYRPDAATACAVGGGGSGQIVSIARGDPCYCTGPCVYVAAVVCPGTPQRDPTCVYDVVATTSSTTPVALADGAFLFHGVAPGAYRYFSYDLSLALAGRDNVTVYALAAASGSGVQLVATAALRTLPTLANATWSSSATDSGQSASLTVAWNDPALAACPACTQLVVGVYGTPPPPPPQQQQGTRQPGGFQQQLLQFHVGATSTAGGDAPMRLALGQPSPPGVLAYKSQGAYVVWLAGTAADLVVDVTVLTGKAAVSVDPFSRNARCYVGPPPTRPIRCEGVWSAPIAASGPIRISAADPCANANATRACNASAVWREGPYFINVLSYYSPTSFVVTAFTPDGVVALVDGAPQTVSTTAAAPTVLQLTAAWAADPAPIRFSLSAGALALRYSLGWCVGGSAAGCGRETPPAPGLSGVPVPARSTVTLALAPGSPAGYCLDVSGARQPCSYYITLLPPPACTAGCSAAATVTAASQSGDAPLEVPWTRVTGQVAVVTDAAGDEGADAAGGRRGGASPPPSRAAVELFLPPGAVSSEPVDVALVLDACSSGSSGSGGGGGVLLLVCDPSIPPPAGCANAYRPDPAPGGSTASNSTAGAAYGRATLLVPQTSASVLYLAVTAAVTAGGAVGAAAAAAGAAAPPGGGLALAALGFSLELSARSAGAPPPLFLATSASGSPLDAPANVTLGSGGGTVAWPPARLGAFDGSASAAAVGVVYTVYAAPGGFVGSAPPQAGIQPLTACGLQRWEQLVPAGAAPVVLTLPGVDVTSVGLSALLGPAASGYYEVAVVASCNATCLLAAAASGGGAPGGGAPLDTQLAAYAWVGLVVAPPVPPAPGPPGGPSAAATAGYSLGGLALLAALGCAAVVGYRRHVASNAYDALTGGTGGLGLLRPDGFDELGDGDDAAGGGPGEGGSPHHGVLPGGAGDVEAPPPPAGAAGAALAAARRRASSGASRPATPASIPSRSPTLRATRLTQLRASVSVSSPVRARAAGAALSVARGLRPGARWPPAAAAAAAAAA